MNTYILSDVYGCGYLLFFIYIWWFYDSATNLHNAFQLSIVCNDSNKLVIFLWSRISKSTTQMTRKGQIYVDLN